MLQDLNWQQVWVVGPNLFQNELLCSHLAGCLRIDHYASVPKPKEIQLTVATRALILVDCFGLDFVRIKYDYLPDLARLSSCCLVVLFNLDEKARIEAVAMQSGVRGFFYCTDRLETFRLGVESVLNGEIGISRERLLQHMLAASAATRIMKNEAEGSLTRREMEILHFIRLGVSNEVIALKLFISPHTVRTHIQKIFRKIGVNNRIQASLWASTHLTVQPH